MANFKDALLEGTPSSDTKPEKASAPAKETAPKAPKAVEATPAQAETAETPEVEKVEEPKQTVISSNPNKIYYAIGLKDYSTVIAGLPVHVQAGKPWQGTKYQYDTLKRAKLIQ